MAVHTLGCKVNRVEGEKVMADLLDRGFSLGDEVSADVVVINTCSVTGDADKKARKAIRHALAANPGAKVIVTGCLAALESDAVAALDARVIVEPDTDRVAERVERAAGTTRAPAGARGSAGERVARTGAAFRTRSLVKIEDGCDAFCAYCIVPFARGNPRSVPAGEIVDECSALVDAGAREIVLTGINLGRYADTNADLAEIVRLVAGTGVPRIRLSSIEPLDLTPRLLGALASTPAFCEHLHVPLQSGDADVLREMGRAYTAADYRDTIAAARAAIPGLAITTDVLVGFPGETDEQAQNTIEFCRSIGFDRMHVFRYSARPRTAAAERDDHVEPAVRIERARRMRELDGELRAASALSALGTEREMLVERVRADTATGTPEAEGTTREYERVRARIAAGRGEIAAGSLARVILGGARLDGWISAAFAEGRNSGSVS